MDPRVFTTIAAYLGQIENKLIWPFLATRHVKLGAVSNMLLRILVQASAFSGGNCTVTEDCDQGEKCIDGTCVPRMDGLNLVFAPADEALLPLGEDAKAELDGCFVQIYEAMSRALAKDSSNLSRIRDLLMSTYAGALTLTGGSSGGSLKRCSGLEDCGEGMECVDGVCVPIPFKLKFQPERVRRTPPWGQ